MVKIVELCDFELDLVENKQRFEEMIYKMKKRREMKKKDNSVSGVIESNKDKKKKKIKDKYDTQQERYLKLDNLFEKNKYKENIEETMKICQDLVENNFVTKEKSQEDIVIKINDQVERTGLAEKSIDDYVKNIIRKIASGDKDLASFYAINPSKQSIWQTRFRDRIESEIGGRDNLYVDNLQGSKKKKDKMYCHENGDFSRGKESEHQRDVDYGIYLYEGECYNKDYIEKYFYFSHKRIASEGSGQKDQFNELIGFLKNASNSKNSNIHAIVAIEGSYFTKERVKKLKQVASINRTQVFYASDIDSISKYIKNHI